MWQKEQELWGLKEEVISTLPLTRGEILDKLSHATASFSSFRKWESQWWVPIGHMRITQGPSTVPGMWGAPNRGCYDRQCVCWGGQTQLHSTLSGLQATLLA